MKQTPKEKVIEENRAEAARRLAAIDPRRLAQMEPTRERQGRGNQEQQVSHSRHRDRDLEAER